MELGCLACCRGSLFSAPLPRCECPLKQSPSPPHPHCISPPFLLLPRNHCKKDKRKKWGTQKRKACHRPPPVPSQMYSWRIHSHSIAVLMAVIFSLSLSLSCLPPTPFHLSASPFFFLLSATTRTGLMFIVGGALCSFSLDRSLSSISPTPVFAFFDPLMLFFSVSCVMGDALVRRYGTSTFVLAATSTLTYRVYLRKRVQSEHIYGGLFVSLPPVPVAFSHNSLLFSSSLLFTLYWPTFPWVYVCLSVRVRGLIHHRARPPLCVFPYWRVWCVGSLPSCLRMSPLMCHTHSHTHTHTFSLSLLLHSQ